jgi:signal transduction histidine kinase
MHEFAVGLLLLFSSTLGIDSVPETPLEWQVNKAWEETVEGYFVFSATSSYVIEACQRYPSHYIEFPSTIHSSTQIIVKDQIIAGTSPPNFQHTRGFYGALIIPCAQLHGATGPLIWQVKSYTKYFAWFKYFPKIVKQYPKSNVFNETLNVVAAAILLSLSLLYLLLFLDKIPRKKLALLIFSNFFTAFYFILNTAEFFGLSISMLLSHKLADSGLWIGLACFTHVLHLENLILRWMDIAYKISIAIALAVIFTGSTGDIIQLGTSIPFLFTILLSGYAIFKLLKRGISKSKKEYIQLIALSISFFGYWHDILVVTGVIDSFPILSLAIIGSYIFILLSINESIDNTYAERDQLKELTAILQYTNNELHHAQDELVKSEKMAMMGRAVARIAHELNTPIYAARSAAQNIQIKTKHFAQSLEKNTHHIVDNTRQYNKDLTSMAKVLQISLSRAAELVRNFKEISVDQINVRKKTFDLLEYIDTSLATLTESLRRKNITVNLQGNNITLYHDPSLFYQLINNLVNNAEKYAYPSSGGIIDIEIEELPNEICILFSDYGKGISQIDQSKMFDAFFTTGGGSKGLGLGLNIVYRIVTEKLQGTISCTSQENHGTCFTMRIPKNTVMSNREDIDND